MFPKLVSLSKLVVKLVEIDLNVLSEHVSPIYEGLLLDREQSKWNK